jgi:hypothetical protein
LCHHSSRDEASVADELHSAQALLPPLTSGGSVDQG